MNDMQSAEDRKFLETMKAKDWDLENDALSRRLDEAQAEIVRLTDELDRWQVIAAQRLSTIARLREALRSIAISSCCNKCQEAALVARAALASEGSDAAEIERLRERLRDYEKEPISERQAQQSGDPAKS